MNLKALYPGLLLISPLCLALSTTESKLNQTDLTHLISEYRTSLASRPVDYSLIKKEQLSGVTLQRYNLHSQTWSPQEMVTPGNWQHGVDIYIPDSAKEKRALVVINNGSNADSSGNPVEPTNFDAEKLARIAQATQTIVISISNIPNQPLSYQGNSALLSEDDSVAYSWKLFLNDTQNNQNLSLHIPMAAAVSQTLRLARQELTQWKIDKFIVTGASKRGWAAWLTALSDPDVDAVVPFVMDLLDTKDALTHMYRTYGNNWPAAFLPYYQQGVDQRIDTDEFASLMTLEDPLAYLNSDFKDRFTIEKYIINASGDDFYVPDNSRFYYDQLPGPKSLRVAPNSTHNGILAVSEQSLVTFVNRFQQNQKLPEIKEEVTEGKDATKTLSVTFSEAPMRVLQWTAQNPVARDFRYACEVKYTSTPLAVPEGGDTVTVPLTGPETGWQATYVEATFKDGFVATSQVWITPDDRYPEVAPPAKGGACQTLPGRGLTPAQR